jgi:hypothetical protein
MALASRQMAALTPLGKLDSPARQQTSEEPKAKKQARPLIMPSSRLSARLGQLPHNMLAELATQLCSESPALQLAAEECMAAHTPLPHEMVERVLLSPDLLPHILGPLKAEDGTAAAVCSLWLTGWKATNEPRRRLKQVPLDFPEELVTSGMQMVGTPDGRLVVCAGSEVHILDRSMRVLQSRAASNLQRGPCFYRAETWFAADDDSIFYLPGKFPFSRTVCRSTYDGTTVAEHRLDGPDEFLCGLLAPGGLLYCTIYDLWDVTSSVVEIIVLDAQTMQLRHRFGLGEGLLCQDMGGQHLCVVADELYVSCRQTYESNSDRLQVFSLTGEHRRTIMGEWEGASHLCSAKDRLYLEVDQLHSRRERGCRVLVLSLQGDILQVVTHPTEPTALFKSICCCFDHKLLVLDGEKAFHPQGWRWVRRGVLALQGV